MHGSTSDLFALWQGYRHSLYNTHIRHTVISAPWNYLIWKPKTPSRCKLSPGMVSCPCKISLHKEGLVGSLPGLPWLIGWQRFLDLLVSLLTGTSPKWGLIVLFSLYNGAKGVWALVNKPSVTIVWSMLCAEACVRMLPGGLIVSVCANTSFL